MRAKEVTHTSIHTSAHSQHQTWGKAGILLWNLSILLFLIVLCSNCALTPPWLNNTCSILVKESNGLPSHACDPDGTMRWHVLLLFLAELKYRKTLPLSTVCALTMKICEFSPCAFIMCSCIFLFGTRMWGWRAKMKEPNLFAVCPHPLLSNLLPPLLHKRAMVCRQLQQWYIFVFLTKCELIFPWPW